MFDNRFNIKIKEKLTYSLPPPPNKLLEVKKHLKIKICGITFPMDEN